jgi:aminoglycoside phosphotransferase (APT) family kinase protein
MAETVLHGGVGNAGLVTKVGDTVRRPWRASTTATHAVLAHLNEVLPGVAPVPLGRDEQGREVLSFIAGMVAVPPFPQWVADEQFLVSLGQLLRRIHDVLAIWQPPTGLEWSDQIPDPHGGPLIVHADVCPENVVTRDGRAVAIIDWEFAAPGRRIWDVVSTARLCVPFTAPARRDSVYRDVNVIDRLQIFLDAYGLAAMDRRNFAQVLDERRRAGERFTRHRVARGEAAFIQKWGTPEGERLFVVEREWVDAVPTDIATRHGPGLAKPDDHDYLLS